MEGNSEASTSKSPSQPTPAVIKPPTVLVTYAQTGKTVKARVDKAVPLAEVLRQLVASTQLGISEPAALFALRCSNTGELVTDDNLHQLLDRGSSFILASSPTLEAAEIVEKLQSGEASVLKLATFSLRTLIQEHGFLNEFLLRGGLDALQDVVKRSSGNTLAYALLSLQNLINERGWEGLELDFAGRIVEIITTQPLINISRPAIAILHHLSQTPLDTIPGHTLIAKEVATQPEFLRTLVGKLSSGDLPVANLALGLINVLFKGAVEDGNMTFADELEELGANRVVGKMLETQRDASGDINQILAFQANLAAHLTRSLSLPVTESHYGLFDDLWSLSSLDEPDREDMRWRSLGYQTESPQLEYDKTGVLGLKAFAHLAKKSNNTHEYAKILKEQQQRPVSRRCPLATASSIAVLALVDHFALPSVPTTPQPFLLRFYECHALGTFFFVRMWTESNASISDIPRVEALLRSQIANALGVGAQDKAWYDVKLEFQLAEYKTVRERQMREMEIEDDILNKAPVRNLRGRLYRESYEFIKNQRFACLHEGCWFRTVASIATAASTGTPNRKSVQAHSNVKPWRFYRLAANRKTLHWLDANEKVEIKGGLEDLSDKIDVVQVTEVVGSATNARYSTISSARSPTSTLKTQSSVKNHSRQASANRPPSSVPLSLTLLSNEGVLAELVAPDQATYAEWVDGLALLRPDGNITTRETAHYIQILTEVGVKIKLLDLSGERLEVPTNLQTPPVPRSTDFYYSDNL